MPNISPVRGGAEAAGRRNVRRPIDDVDLLLVELLRKDGRATYAELAAAAGIAPSTCLTRVRALLDSGVVTGFSARIDPRTLGFTVQALISVNIKAGARQTIASFAAEVRTLPEVTQVFFLGGAEDFILDVAVRDSDHLRDFVVENLSSHPSVASTRTSLVFSHESPGLRLR